MLLSRSFHFLFTVNIAVLQPLCGRNRISLGYSPFARHYLGNHFIVFSSSGYLDVSVLRVCAFAIHLQCTRFPHSEIFGSKVIRHLPEAYRSLSRLSSPIRAKASSIRPYLLSCYQFPGNILVFSFSICQRTSPCIYSKDSLKNPDSNR